MKKLKKILLAICAMAILVTTTSCYGTFTLTKTVYEWNGDATDDKWANSIITWALIIIPVYQVCAFVDFVVLNAIEFWTGENPLAMNDGDIDTQTIHTGDKVYQITATKNKFNIEQIEGNGKGQSVDLNYNANEGSWYVSNDNGTFKIAQGDIKNRDWIKIFHPDGKVEEIAMK